VVGLLLAYWTQTNLNSELVALSTGKCEFVHTVTTLLYAQILPQCSANEVPLVAFLNLATALILLPQIRNTLTTWPPALHRLTLWAVLQQLQEIRVNCDVKQRTDWHTRPTRGAPDGDNHLLEPSSRLHSAIIAQKQRKRTFPANGVLTRQKHLDSLVLITYLSLSSIHTLLYVVCIV